MADSLISGKIIMVRGGRFSLEIIASRREVILWTLPEEEPISSLVPIGSYAYTHGGWLYQLAVHRAKEIAEQLGFDAV